MMQLPLSVVLGHYSQYPITHLVSRISWRHTIPGGFASARISLDSPLDEQALRIQYGAIGVTHGVGVTSDRPFLPVTIYDTRTADVVFEGHAEDLGQRAGDRAEGMDLVVIGPAGRLEDWVRPYLFIDTGWESWEPYVNQPRVRQEVNDGSLTVTFAQGSTIDPFMGAGLFYRVPQDSGQKLGRVDYTHDSYGTDTNYVVALQTLIDGAFDAIPRVDTMGSGEASNPQLAGTDFDADANSLLLYGERGGIGSETPSVTKWVKFSDPVVMAQLGGEASPIIPTQNYLMSDEVIRHLLTDTFTVPSPGGYTWSSATLDLAAGTYQITQLVYPDGASPRRILDDLMTLEGDYYYAAWESDAYTAYLATAVPEPDEGRLVRGAFHRFEWRQWPTHVRYEASVVDGLNSQASSADRYKRVAVRYVDGVTGRPRWAYATDADLGGFEVERELFVDLGNVVGDAAAAQQAADALLEQHSVRIGRGVVTIARPIYDADKRMMVAPQEIRPGHLIRLVNLRAEESSISATGRDGDTVFQVKAVDFDSDACAARLELDDYAPQLPSIIRGLDLRSRLIRR